MSGTRVDGVVVHHAVGAALAQGDGPRERGSRSSRRSSSAITIRRERMEENIVRSRLRHEVPGWTPVRPRRAPPAPGYDHAPTAAAAPRPRRTAPRRAGARPTRPAPTRRTDRRRSRTGAPRASRRPSWKVGFGPWFIMPLGAAAAPLDPHRVDAVGRQQLLRRHVGQVDRRHAEQPAAPLALHHPPAHLVRPAEHPGGGGQVAAGDGAPDPRAGDVLLADVHRLDHVHVEPALGAEAAQGLDVAAPAAAEAVIVPDHQLAHLAAVEQHLARRTPRA